MCCVCVVCVVCFCFFFFQAEGGIRDLVRSRGLGDGYKRQEQDHGPGAVRREIGRHVDLVAVDAAVLRQGAVKEAGGGAAGRRDRGVEQGRSLIHIRRCRRAI